MLASSTCIACVCAHRGAVAERLQRKGLFCEPLDYTYWRKFMFERLIFDSVSLAAAYTISPHRIIAPPNAN